MYRSKGTKFGIVDAVFFFLGIEITLTTGADFDGWVLGEGDLGEDTALRPATSRKGLYTFDIEVGQALTPDQRTKMLAVVNYMKVAHEHIGKVIEPTTATQVDVWSLGVGLLGEDTILQESVAGS